MFSFIIAILWLLPIITLSVSITAGLLLAASLLSRKNQKIEHNQ